MLTSQLKIRLAALILAFVVLSAGCGPAEPSISNVEQRDVQPAAGGDDGAADALPESAPVNPSQEQVLPDPADGVTLQDDPSKQFALDGIEVGFTAEGRPYKGNPNAELVLEEFSDYQCPYCARFYQQTLPHLNANQIATGELLLVYYDFPLSSIHPQATAAANAARCAGEQGAAAYWGMHDLIFGAPETWSNANASETFAGFAGELGLDLGQFTDCEQSNRYYQEIDEDIALGRSRGVNSTPSFFLNQQPIIGAQPVAAFNQAIAAVKAGEPIASAADPAPSGDSLPAPTPAAIALEDGAGRMGEPRADVTIVEYTDYQCPYCQRHSQQTIPRLISNMVDSGRVHYVVKDFPLENIHPEARSAAIAARCAGEQGVYWKMHDALFASQSQWSGSGTGSVEVFSQLFGEFGSDQLAFRQCLESGRYDAAVQANLDEGRGLGVTGTPFFFINGFPINGAQPYELFEYAIGLAEEGQLAEAYTRPSEPQQAATPVPAGPVDIPVGGSFSIGSLDAPVVIIEYTDYQCPFCSRHFEQTMPLLKADYIDTGLVRYVFKDFPLTNIHPQAVSAAEAARCAGDQEAYLEMHDMLFTTQQQWSGREDAADIFIGLAVDLGLDEATFTSCLKGNDHREAVLADLNEGIGFGIRGTPGFFLNGYFLSGAQPYSVFQQAINSLLSR